MIASMSQRVYLLMQQVEQLKAQSGVQRVAGFLASLAPVDHGPCVIALPYDKALIAARLGLTPSSLSRTFAKLRSVGVAVRAADVAVGDVAKLRQLARRRHESGRRHRRLRDGRDDPQHLQARRRRPYGDRRLHSLAAAAAGPEAAAEEMIFPCPVGRTQRVRNSSHVAESAADRRFLVLGEPAKLGDVAHCHIRSAHGDPD